MLVWLLVLSDFLNLSVVLGSRPTASCEDFHKTAHKYRVLILSSEIFLNSWALFFLIKCYSNRRNYLSWTIFSRGLIHIGAAVSCSSHSLCPQLTVSLLREHGSSSDGQIGLFFNPSVIIGHSGVNTGSKLLCAAVTPADNSKLEEPVVDLTHQRPSWVSLWEGDMQY